MITPRPYLSWSSMSLFESNLERWKRLYINGERLPINRGMALGKQMADSLEHNEATGDPMLDLVVSMLPKYDLMDVPLETHIKDGKKTIPILIKPDSMKRDMTAFLEYKTGQALWTRKQVDESGQVTFYATGIFLKCGKIPKDIELVHVQTYKEDGERLAVTGDIFRHKTTRSMTDILKMLVRMKKAWYGIQAITSDSFF